MQCGQCGADNKDGARFCRQCGGALSVAPTPSTGPACPACGTVNAAGGKFCKSCGTPLGVAAAPVAEPTPAPETEEPPTPASVPVTEEESPPATPAWVEPEELAVEEHAQRVTPTEEPTLTATPSRGGMSKPVMVSAALVTVLVAAGIAWKFWPSQQAASAPETNAQPLQAAPAALAVPPTEAAPAPAAPEPVKPAEPEPAPVQPVVEAPKPPAAPLPAKKPVEPAPKPVATKPTAPVAPAPALRPVEAAPAPKPQVPAQPAPAQSSIDHALAECGRISSFFERKVCQEKARVLNCEGLWGKHPECPDRSW